MTPITELDALSASYLIASERAAGEVDLDKLHLRRRSTESVARREAGELIRRRYRDPKRPDMVTTAVESGRVEA